jgi:hypothetical protein
MISGTLVLEDLSITFMCDQSAVHTATYIVSEGLAGETETRTVPVAPFLAALGIALHLDGEPNAERDYSGAESVQPENRRLRFIP